MLKIARFLMCCVGAVAAFSPISATGSELKSCGGNTVCPVGDRGYHVMPPDGWDGQTPLPVLIHYHGWGRQGPVPVNHKHIGGATRKLGVLLVAPNGLGKSWSFWRPGSRDTQFTLDVLADVEKRYPINPSQIMVSGYSWGSSMAWRFSCEMGHKVSVLFGISGTLYDQSETCETGPVEIRHVHGLKDTVMDYPYGPNLDETGPIHLWRRTNQCATDPDFQENWSAGQNFRRMHWSDCESGKTITLDIHEGGHWIARGWLAEQLRQLDFTGS